VALKLIYQTFAKLLSWMVLHARSDTVNEVEILEVTGLPPAPALQTAMLDVPGGTKKSAA